MLVLFRNSLWLDIAYRARRIISLTVMEPRAGAISDVDEDESFFFKAAFVTRFQFALLTFAKLSGRQKVSVNVGSERYFSTKENCRCSKNVYATAMARWLYFLCFQCGQTLFWKKKTFQKMGHQRQKLRVFFGTNNVQLAHLKNDSHDAVESNIQSLVKPR